MTVQPTNTTAGKPPAKPLLGQPCNGCGLCCAVEPCQLAVDYLDDPPAPCPAMRWEEGRFLCGLVVEASAYIDTPPFGDDLMREMFSHALGIGRGCDASDDVPSVIPVPRAART